MNEISIIKNCLEEIQAQFKANSVYSKEFFTFKEACQYLGISESTLYKFTSELKISYSKPNGKLTYFRKSDLDTWMMQNREEAIC